MHQLFAFDLQNHAEFHRNTFEKGQELIDFFRAKIPKGIIKLFFSRYQTNHMFIIFSMSLQRELVKAMNL